MFDIDQFRLNVLALCDPHPATAEAGWGMLKQQIHNASSHQLAALHTEMQSLVITKVENGGIVETKETWKIISDYCDQYKKLPELMALLREKGVVPPALLRKPRVEIPREEIFFLNGMSMLADLGKKVMEATCAHPQFLKATLAASPYFLGETHLALLPPQPEFSRDKKSAAQAQPEEFDVGEFVSGVINTVVTTVDTRALLIEQLEKCVEATHEIFKQAEDHILAIIQDEKLSSELFRALLSDQTQFKLREGFIYDMDTLVVHLMKCSPKVARAVVVKAFPSTESFNVLSAAEQKLYIDWILTNNKKWGIRYETFEDLIRHKEDALLRTLGFSDKRIAQERENRRWYLPPTSSYTIPYVVFNEDNFITNLVKFVTPVLRHRQQENPPVLEGCFTGMWPQQQKVLAHLESLPFSEVPVVFQKKVTILEDDYYVAELLLLYADRGSTNIHDIAYKAAEKLEEVFKRAAPDDDLIKEIDLWLEEVLGGRDREAVMSARKSIWDFPANLAIEGENAVARAVDRMLYRSHRERFTHVSPVVQSEEKSAYDENVFIKNLQTIVQAFATIEESTHSQDEKDEDLQDAMYSMRPHEEVLRQQIQAASQEALYEVLTKPAYDENIQTPLINVVLMYCSYATIKAILEKAVLAGKPIIGIGAEVVLHNKQLNFFQAQALYKVAKDISAAPKEEKASATPSPAVSTAAKAGEAARTSSASPNIPAPASADEKGQEKFDSKKFKRALVSVYIDAEVGRGESEQDRTTLLTQIKWATGKALCELLHTAQKSNVQMLYPNAHLAKLFNHCSFEVCHAVLTKMSEENALADYFKKFSYAVESYLYFIGQNDSFQPEQKTQLNVIVNAAKNLAEAKKTEEASQGNGGSKRVAADTPLVVQSNVGGGGGRRAPESTLPVVQHEPEAATVHRQPKSSAKPAEPVSLKWYQRLAKHIAEHPVRYFLGVAMIAFVLALCFSPLGPIVFAGLPLVGAALAAAAGWVASVGVAGYFAAAGAALVAGFLTWNLDRVVGVAIFIVIEIGKFVMSVPGKILNAIAASAWNAVTGAGLKAMLGGIVLLVVGIPALITGLLAKAFEWLREIKLLHKVVMAVRGETANKIIPKVEPKTFLERCGSEEGGVFGVLSDDTEAYLKETTIQVHYENRRRIPEEATSSTQSKASAVR